DECGRLRRDGTCPDFRYDESGRLVEAKVQYRYDGRGRLQSQGETRISYADGPMATGLDGPSGSVAFAYDALGRRTERHGPEGISRYHYNLFGQLCKVDLPDGETIEYLYDGFGRLFGRRTSTQTSFYITGINGNRLVETDEQGRPVWSYLWA